MFIELDVIDYRDSNLDDARYETRTINTNNIDEFYPAEGSPKSGRTKLWLKHKDPIIINLTYDKFRDLLSMVSLLVNE